MITRYNEDVSVEKYETTQHFPLLSLAVDYQRSVLRLGADFNKRIYEGMSKHKLYHNYVAAALRKFRKHLLKGSPVLEETQYNVGTRHKIVSEIHLFSYKTGTVTVQLIFYGAIASRTGILKLVISDFRVGGESSQMLLGLRGSREMSEQVMISEIYPGCIRGTSDELKHLFEVTSSFAGSIFPYAYRRTWLIEIE